MSRRRPRHRRPAFTGTTPIAVECPACRAHVAVPPELVGRAAGCPACRTAFLVPKPEREAPLTTESPDRPKRKRRQPLPAGPSTDASSGASDPATTEPAPVGESRPAAPAAGEQQPRREDPVVFTEPPPPRARGRHGTAADAAGVGAAADHAADPDTPAASGVGQRRPDAASDSGALAFREPVKTIRDGDKEIELRQLTPEERRSRRTRRNLLLLVVGATLLVALATLLGRGNR